MDASVSTCSLGANTGGGETSQRHPGGKKSTMRLIRLSAVEPCRILDLGAGSGVTLTLLRELGFDACGIDLDPGEGVDRGDMLGTGFPAESFDAVISECSFYISGDARGALREANRLLKKGGKLLLSDIFSGDEEDVRTFLREGGFNPLSCTDMTDEWKDYYIEKIWNGTADSLCHLKCDDSRTKKFRYFLSISERM